MGWMALCHLTAIGQWCTAQRNWTLAARAPVLHPPSPANRTIVVVIGWSLRCSIADIRTD